MCAIAGYLHFQKAKAFQLKALLELMKHRGPDETNLIEEEQWGLGVNRLAITSVKEKNTQPLWSPDKRYCFIFNGEIYNYKTLKKELLDRNYIFKTSSDTEVLFYTYLEYGLKAFLMGQGMFACAIFDSLEKKWTLVRDPVGIKPLYFLLEKKGFAFSSEIKPLLLLKKPEINRKALPSYLQRRFVMGEETLFRGIFRVQPGSVVIVSLTENLKKVKYWQPETTLTRHTREDFVLSPYKKRKHPKQSTGQTTLTTQAREKFANQLKASIKMSSQSETGKAVLLSGGLDSSVINALASEDSLPLSAYFFDNGYDERERNTVLTLTQKNNQSLNRVFSEKKDFLILPKVIKALEEPLGDSIIVPTYKLMEQVSQKNKVALSGEGADEWLAGYTHHWIFYTLKKFQTLKFLDFHWERMLPESFLNLLLPYPGSFKKSKLLKALQPLRQFGLKRFLEMIPLFDTKESNDLFPELFEETSFSSFFYPNINHLKDLLLFDIQNWLPHYNLLRLDKLSMIHSLEIRVPYLNLDFINTCLNLPEKELISLTTRKKILRHFASKECQLAFNISYRKKHPFTFKETKVYPKVYKDFIRDHLDDSFIKIWGMDKKALLKLLDQKNDLSTEKQISSLLNLAIWTKAFF